MLINTDEIKDMQSDAKHPRLFKAGIVLLLLGGGLMLLSTIE